MTQCQFVPSRGAQFIFAMSLTAFAIFSLSFLHVSRAFDPIYFNPGELDHGLTLHRGLIDIFADNPNAPSMKLIGLMSNDVKGLALPVKKLHELENMVFIWLNEPISVDCTLIEIKYEKGEDARKILASILPRIVGSHTIVLILRNPGDFHLREIVTFMVKVFEIFWEELMTNVAIVFTNTYKNSAASSPSSFGVFTYVYEPYSPEPLRNVSGQRYRGTFYDKVANLHLHPIKVLANEKDRFFIESKQKISEPSEIDGYVTKTIEKIFNATIELNYGDNTAPESHSHLNQVLQMFNNGSVDLWIKIHIIRSDRHHKITSTYPMQQSDVICILPKNRDRRVKYKSIGGSKVLAVGLSMAVLFAVMSFFVYLSSAILKKNFPILKLAKLLTNQSDAIVHKSSSTTVRVLLCNWIIISFGCSTMLQTLITSRIIRPSLDDRLTTIGEVIESNFHLRIELSYWKLTKDHYDEDLLEGMWNDIEVVANGELFKVRDPDIAYITAEYTGRIIDRRSSQFYVLPQTFLPNFLGYYLPKKSPFLPRFDKALMGLTETGVMAKWLADIHRRSINTLEVHDRSSNNRYITYKNLTSVIFLYFICIFFALVVFICELKFQRIFK